MPGDEPYRPWAMAPRPYRVMERRSERPGQLTLTLADPGTVMAHGPAGDPITPAVPGQYWVLHTTAGMKVPAVDVTLAATAPAGSAMEVSTLRVPCGSPVGGVGEQVGVRGPFGSGWDIDVAADRDLLVIAWEAGLALLRPIIERAITAGRHLDRARLRVWAGGRNRQAIPYQKEWNRWSGHAGVTIGVSPTLTMATAAAELRFDPAGVALLAGPLSMARAAAEALRRRGLPADRIQLAVHPLIRCGTGRCGRCQINSPGGVLRACQDGPVLRYDRLTANPPVPGAPDG